jgi:folate-binding protein YgfZ
MPFGQVMPFLPLSHRQIVRVSGEDAERLLQDVITTDLDQLAAGDALPGALLTPQGKILFDFLVSRADDHFRFDIEDALVASFMQRLTLYRLRAKMTIEHDAAVFVGTAWDEAPGSAYDALGIVADQRFRSGRQVHRVYSVAPLAASADPADYDLLRIDEGVAESGRDYALSDAFPHDIWMDRNGGLSFRKGCYVGQEVVSRMQHRGTARRRLAIAEADKPLPPESALTAGGKTIGTLGTVAGERALALVRADRVKAALDGGQDIVADGESVRLALPGWAGLTFDSFSTEE